MFTAYAIFVLTAFGFAGFLMPLSLGFALAGGVSAAILTLYVLATYFSMTVSETAYVLAFLAAVGWFVGAYQLRTRAPSPSVLLHPALVLCAATGAVILAMAPDAEYLPHAWDEMSGWMTWMAQILAADVWLSDDMVDSYPHYPKGWPLIAVYPQVFQDGFDGIRAVAVAAVIHTAALAALYDTFRRLPAIDALPNRSGIVVAWGMLLALVAIEATWILVPSSLEVGRPILYVVTALFAVGFVATFIDRDNAVRVWIVFALLLAMAMSLKTSMSALFAPAAVFALAAPGSWRVRLGRAVLTLLPAVLVAYVWSQLAAAPVPPLASLEMAAFIDTLVGAGSAMLAYVAGYKTPILIVALLGFAWLVVYERRFWVLPAAWLAFAVPFLGGVLFLYLFVMGPTPYETYPSLPRYVRLPFRLLHLFGCMLFMYAVVQALASRWPNLFRHAGLQGLGAVASLCIAIWIYSGAGAVIADLGEKRHEDPLNIERIEMVRSESRALIRLIADEDLSSPAVSIVTQGDDGYLHNVAGLYSVNDRRDGPVQVFRHVGPWSWGETAGNVWMRATARSDLETHFRSVDVVWPMIVDDWVRPILGLLADSDACGTTPTDYFFVRDAASDSGFRCVPKTSG